MASIPGSADRGLDVVAAFYPLQFVAQQVAGDHADVVDLTKPGSEPHDLELSVAQTAEVLTADLVVYEKGLQAAVDAAVGQASGVRKVDAGAVAGLEPRSHDGHDDGEKDARASGQAELRAPFHRETHDDRVLTFVERMPAGLMHFRYLARAMSRGRFLVPPTRAECMYEPEIFGRTAGAVRDNCPLRGLLPRISR